MMTRPTLRLVLPSFALLGAAALFADPFTPSTTGKKLINYGQDWPNTAYVRANIREMEKRPYDGIVIAVSKSREPQHKGTDSIGFRVFSRDRFDIADYQHAIDDLRATKFEKFTDNFIQLESMPGDVDFFDDDGWKNIAHNLKTLAHIAKQGSCKGLEFDPEEYGLKIWTYAAFPDAARKAHAQDEYIAKARQRGQEVMRAINSEFPDIRILFLLGPSFTYSKAVVGNQRYRLLVPFIEGMCTVATAGTQIIDGFEQSYPYRVKISFEEARKLQLATRDIFTDKSAFDRVVRVGFGLWMDNNSGKIGWHPKEPDKNHFQPDTWQSAVHYALSYSDEYVWTWHERFDVWTGENVNFDYLDAQIAARDKPGRTTFDAKPDPNRIRLASDVERHDDASTFKDLLRTHKLLLDLKENWTFRADPDDVGSQEKWFSPDLPSDGWSPIQVGKFWEEQGHDYDGIAWYRVTFKSPAAPGQKLLLSLGAIDESATIWLNGEKLPHQDQGESDWDRRIDLDVSGKLRADQPNVLAIRVLDRVGPGGIWKSVKLFAAP